MHRLRSKTGQLVSRIESARPARLPIPLASRDRIKSACTSTRGRRSSWPVQESPTRVTLKQKNDRAHCGFMKRSPRCANVRREEPRCVRCDGRSVGTGRALLGLNGVIDESVETHC